MGGLGTREADVTLAVAAKVGEELRRRNLSPVLTRTSDVSVSLKQRVNRANGARATAFVSIHCNSAKNDTARGTEAYYHTGSEAGKELAAALNNHLHVATGLFNRGVKGAGFYVLRHTDMPAALVELAFISNEHEEKLLREDEFQAKAAGAIAEGIARHLERARLSR